MEANAIKDKTISQKFQVDCLEELTMIYFRILKSKIGFDLLPMTLKGLGRITHLINIEMVDDLIEILRDILIRNQNSQSSNLFDVKLLSVHCVLRTLLGPGQELQVDDEIFVSTLQQLILEIPLSFKRYTSLFESIEIALLRRREVRVQYINGIIAHLLLLSCHIPSSLSAIALSLVHSIVIRYPKVRQDLHALSSQSISTREEEIEDLAMKALYGHEDGIQGNALSQLNSDGSIVLPLFKHHFHELRFRKMLQNMLSPDIIPIPYRLQDSDLSIEGETLDCLRFVISNETPNTRKIVNISTKHSDKNLKSFTSVLDKTQVVNTNCYKNWCRVRQSMIK